ncbi:uncharacterized protein PHALS_15117 [Plasmopara halstedii]|uniref:Uncharacterized protein n=1 Tax=Plasmopara halstedii TaxID=4781 RepID=A0A0N7L465_PLAHL|nr:uncharacterized protein PHALS_15117 [Plasmopara halstedii]CEG37811.1 hypothetical protein PHALS_15117 [Plasmopara halstedii]|eukprot:XP_024574180.1 hypothetical protein PHALS_15117 [Plasmopara halstedii]
MFFPTMATAGVVETYRIMQASSLGCIVCATINTGLCASRVRCFRLRSFMYSNILSHYTICLIFFENRNLPCRSLICEAVVITNDNHRQVHTIEISEHPFCYCKPTKPRYDFDLLLLVAIQSKFASTPTMILQFEYLLDLDSGDAKCKPSLHNVHSAKRYLNRARV